MYFFSPILFVRSTQYIPFAYDVIEILFHIFFYILIERLQELNIPEKMKSPNRITYRENVHVEAVSVTTRCVCS